MPGLKVLSAGAVKRGVARVCKDFEQATGMRVAVEFETAPEIRKRVASGETADVLVVPPASMDEFQQQGRIVAESRGHVGRSRMGVVVHKSAPAPELGDTAAFKRAVLAADPVVYNTASSGVYVAKLFERLGLKDQLGSRAVILETGSAVLNYVAAHPPAALGLTQIPEIMVLIEQGCAVKLAGPLPDEIQNVTSYDAAAVSGSPDAARKLAASLSSPAAKKVFAATGVS